MSTSAPLLLDRITLISDLAGLYQEWRDAAHCQPLGAVSASVRLLREDMMGVLSLTALEQGQVKDWWRKGFSDHAQAA